MKNKNALIIIAKYPANGSVKTRLSRYMPDNKILELYIHLLESTVHKLRSIPGVDTFIAYAPPEADPYFSKFNLGLLPLYEGDLGERMFSAFKQVFEKGYRKTAIVGADIPDISPDIILDSFDTLSVCDLVYGPAVDGGYYLVGMNKLIREVFDNVPWSSDQTLTKSLEQAEQAGHSVGFTETLSDIDTVDDVKKSGLFIP